MGFSADITGTLAGLIPAQQAALSGLAAPARAAKLKTEPARSSITDKMTPAGELLPIGLIREAVQECLQDSIQDTASSLHALMADDEIVELLHLLMKKPGDQETVGRSLQDVVDAFAELAAKDGQPEDVVRAIETFIARLQSTTRQLAQLRIKTIGHLQQGLTSANTVLARIAETNREITLSGATGQSTRSAAAHQQANLAELAKAIDFTSFRRGDGSVAVYTKRGINLVNHDAKQLALSEDGVCADGIDIKEQLSGGAVHGYLHNRDFALPHVESQLDTLAQTLQSRLNQISNRALAGPDAQRQYFASRSFPDCARHQISVVGGDCEIALLQADGAVKAQISLIAVIRQFRRQAGLPSGSHWPIGQVAAALQSWLQRQIPAAGGPFVRLSDNGAMAIDVPAEAGLRLALRDRRSLTLQSSNLPSLDKPLGWQGQLTLTDGLGNEFSTAPARGGIPLSPGDSLGMIAGKLNRIEGLSARILPHGNGGRLIIASLAGSDLSVEPDIHPDSMTNGLNLIPADDQAVEDVAVNAFQGGPANSVNSRAFPHRATALGLQGCLIVRSQDGAMLAFQTVQADWSLERLEERLRDASDPRLTASLFACGNQVAVKLASTNFDDRFVIEGLPEGWQTSPRFHFTAQGGDLAISIKGTALPPLAIASGTPLAALIERINEPDRAWAQAGLRAQMLHAGNAEILDIAHAQGLPLSFAGSAVGPAPGQLDLRYNLRDQLGLAAAADQVVPGFANFFGLNDMFVADPTDAFDAKAAIGIFTSTAQPGTAGALTLNPGMAQDPKRLGTTATIRQMSDLLCNSLNIAAAGDLPKGSYRLAQYAENIVAQVHQAARSNKTMLTYHKALLDQLARQKATEINVNDRLSDLMTLQQTYQDSTQIVASLSRLVDQLRVSAH